MPLTKKLLLVAFDRISEDRAQQRDLPACACGTAWLTEKLFWQNRLRNEARMVLVAASDRNGGRAREERTIRLRLRQLV